MIEAVVGLGNIGERYLGTRHNVGFDVLDLIARRQRVDWNHSLNNSVVCDLRLQDRTIRLVRPTTMMNRSGRAIVELLERFDLTPDVVLVVVDDFNLPLETLRFRLSGSDGGHNGLMSIIESIGTTEFPRLRLGIGAPPDRDQIVAFVLGQFESADEASVSRMIDRAAEAVLFAIEHRVEDAMSKYNSNPALPSDE